jgi:glycosyltransferase involved in cell wall biosynthesis
MNITVVIPTYNRYELLKRALRSVVCQTYQPKEIIVIDDGSTDKTSQIKNDFPNIIYIYQENAGVSSARNLAIKKSSYKWIAFLDSDDEWLSNKLELQVKFHKENKNSLISYTDEIWIRNDIEVNIPKKYKKISGSIFQECLSHCFIAPSSVIINKNLFTVSGLFDEELEVCEDYDLWIRIAIEHKIGLVNKKLIRKYAGHENQLSFKYWGMDRFRCIALEKLYVNKQNILVKKELNKKYTILLKGAIKHGIIQDIKNYKEKLKLYE